MFLNSGVDHANTPFVSVLLLQPTCYGFFKPYTLVNMVRSLDKEGAAVPFKSMQACDNDVC